MPWSAKQQRAIAVKLREEGKTSRQISDFFAIHNGGTGKKGKKGPRKSYRMVTRG